MRLNAEENTFRADFCVLRTPYLEADALLELGADLEVQAAHHDPTTIGNALRRDAMRVRERLARLVARPDIREALFLASPSLEAHIERWQESPQSQRGQKVQRSVLRYLSRMAGRATPFGLFAGYSIGTVTDTDEIQLRLAPQHMYQRHTRLDGGYLGELSEALQADPATQATLRYFPNSSLYQACGRYRYVQTRRAGNGHSHHLVAVEPTVHLRVALLRAAGGAFADEIARAVRAAGDDVTIQDAREYIAELIAQQILVCALDGPVAGRNLSSPMAARVAQTLVMAHTALAEFDAYGPGARPSRYRQLAATLGELGADVELALLFHVDLIKPAAVNLSREVIDEFAHGAQLLSRIGGRRPADLLARFRIAFRERYGHREDVPLSEALDEDVGVGFALATVPAPPAPLLDGLAFEPLEPQRRAELGERDVLLLRWLSEALSSGRDAIELGTDQIEALEAACEAGAVASLPDAFAVNGSVLASDERAVAQGRFRVHVAGVSGPSGATALGRFCGHDRVLLRAVRDHLRAEEALHPDAIFAEVVHLPQNRMANVLSRPALRDHEIVYLGTSSVSREHQIEVSDLMVGVVDGRVVLRSLRLDREVVPRLTAAHNFAAAGNIGLYQFLCATQGQGVASALSFSWGVLEHAPHLPRISAGRVILSRARWNLARDQLDELGELHGAKRFAWMQECRHTLGMPRWVALADGDNLLPLDLDNVLSVDMAAQLLKRHACAMLVELFLGPEDLPARGPEGRFVHELIVPFVRVRQPSGVRPPARARTACASARTFQPGSEWLFAKLYTGCGAADAILLRLTPPLFESVLSNGAADSWFFVRHADPDWHLRVRFHGSPERLLGEVLPALLDGCAPLLAEGLLRRISLDAYEREVERYGGDVGVRLAERVFCADSDAALGVLRSVIGDDHGADMRWRLALIGIDRLLTDLGLNLTDKQTTVKTARERFRSSLRVDAALMRRLADRFRSERSSLQALFDPTAESAPGLDYYEARSVKLRPIAEQFCAGARAGRITQSLTALGDCFMHMHVNRMLAGVTEAQELVLYDFLCRLYDSQAAWQRRLAATVQD